MASPSGSKVSISARLQFLALASLLAGCGGEQEPRPSEEREERAQAPVAPAPQPSPPAEPEPQAAGLGEPKDAAEVLARYYDLIRNKRYQEAARLREAGGRAPTAAELAAAFGRYAEHKVTVGTPSPAIDGGEWLYVEVPVQRYGKYRGGRAFGNAGTVTLRRRKASGSDGWRIVTS